MCTRSATRLCRHVAINAGIRLFLWVLPVFFYLRFVDGVDPLAYLKLRHSWRRGLSTGLALTTVIFMVSLARFGMPQWATLTVTWGTVLGPSIIGVAEEIPYRGFIMQKLDEQSS